MILAVDTGAKTMALVEPDDCGSITMRVTGSTNPADIDEVLMGVGRLAGDAAWITIDAIRALAENAGVGDGWDARFRSLIDEAGRRGALNDDRTYIDVAIT